MLLSPTLSQLLHTRYPDVESEKAALKRWAAPTLTSEKPYLGSAVPSGLVLHATNIPPSRIATLESRFHYRALVSPLAKATLGLLAVFLCLLRPDVFFGPSPLPFFLLAIWFVLSIHSKGFPLLLAFWQRRHNRRIGLWLAWLGNVEVLPYLVRALQKAPRTASQRQWYARAEMALADLLDTIDGRPQSAKLLRNLRRLLAPAFATRGSRVRHDLTEARASLCVAILRFLDRTGNTGLFESIAGDTMTCAVAQKSMPHRALVHELARVYLDVPEPLIVRVTLPVAAPPVMRTRP